MGWKRVEEVSHRIGDAVDFHVEVDTGCRVISEDVKSRLVAPHVLSGGQGIIVGEFADRGLTKIVVIDGVGHGKVRDFAPQGPEACSLELGPQVLVNPRNEQRTQLVVVNLGPRSSIVETGGDEDDVILEAEEGDGADDEVAAEVDGMSARLLVNVASSSQAAARFVPSSVAEALQYPKWKAAIEEMGGLEWQGVFEFVDPVDLPAGTRVFPSKGILERKIGADGQPVPGGGKFRAVFRGDRQHEGIEYFGTAAQVVHSSVTLLLLALACYFGWAFEVVDVAQAFVNAPLDRILYMRQLRGLEVPGKEHWVYRLLKSLYGLKQAALLWARYFTSLLIEMGFTRSKHDEMLFFKWAGGNVIFVAVQEKPVVFCDNAAAVNYSDHAIKH